MSEEVFLLSIPIFDTHFYDFTGLRQIYVISLRLDRHSSNLKQENIFSIVHTCAYENKSSCEIPWIGTRGAQLTSHASISTCVFECNSCRDLPSGGFNVFILGRLRAIFCYVLRRLASLIEQNETGDQLKLPYKANKGNNNDLVVVYSTNHIKKGACSL